MTTLFKSAVPLRSQTMAMLGFARRFQNVVAIVNGPQLATFYCGAFNHFNIPTGCIHGNQEKSQTDNALKRFNNGQFDVLFVSVSSLAMAKVEKPQWCIMLDLPPEVEVLSSIVDTIKTVNFILFLDNQFERYMEKVNAAKLQFKEKKLDTKSIPKQDYEVVKLVTKKNYAIYTASQFGYREIISAYVNHPYNDIFQATKLNLLDVSNNYGITAPPKLPLTK